MTDLHSERTLECETEATPLPLGCKAGDPSLIFPLERFIYTPTGQSKNSGSLPLCFQPYSIRREGDNIYKNPHSFFQDSSPNIQTPYVYKVLIYLALITSSQV